jgi:hypothetical protein
MACTEPTPMLHLLKGRASEQKLRSFACAVCVRIASRVGSDCWDAVAVAERYASGQGDDCDLLIAAAWIQRTLHPSTNTGDLDTDFFTVGHVGLVGELPGFNSIVELASHFDGADLLRCMFNPFRPSSPLLQAILAWNDATVRRIAEGIYAERAFDRMPILHDALLDAGCDDEALLSHCRDSEDHVRGCWALDLLLGKE